MGVPKIVTMHVFNLRERMEHVSFLMKAHCQTVQQFLASFPYVGNLNNYFV